MRSQEVLYFFSLSLKSIQYEKFLHCYEQKNVFLCFMLCTINKNRYTVSNRIEIFTKH